MFRSALIAVAALAAASPALADEVVTGINPSEAIVTKLGPDSSAMTYWSAGPKGREVVTTIDTIIKDGEGHRTDRHSIVRVSTVVAPGGVSVISIPSVDNTPSRELKIHDTGNRIEVVRQVDTTVASNLN